MKFSVFAFLLPALLACSAPEFKAFAAADGRFQVQVPAPMEYQSRTVDFADGEITMHSYAAEVDGIVYGVNYFDVPEEINAGLKKQRPSMFAIPGRDLMLRNNGWIAAEIRGDQVWVGSDKRAFGEHFTATAANGRQFIHVRLLWFGNRMYQVMAAHPGKLDSLDAMYAKRFTDSFKILPTES
jgi:hypothetical protein